MAVPNVSYKVEIAWTSNWLTPAASRVWTDVSAYVELQEGVSIDYGRSDELSIADANTLTLTFDNKDGRFTWGNAASPYYPNVKIGKPIRVIATVGGVDYVRFTGLVNEWPVEWPGETASFATATITASSRLSRLGLSSPVVNTVDQVHLSLSPDHYWPLAEATRTEAVDAGPTATPLLSRPPVTFGSGADDDALPFGVDGRTGVILTGNGAVTTEGAALIADLPAPITIGPGDPGGVTLSLFVRVTNPNDPSVPGPGYFARLFDKSDGEDTFTDRFIALELTGGVIDDIGLSYGGSWPTISTSDALHHLAVTVSCDGVGFTAAGYIDGVSGGTAGNPAFALTLDCLAIHAPAYNALVGRVAVYSRALSASEVADLAASGLNALSGETTDARMERYASWANIPATEVTTTASPVALSGVSTEGGQVEALMRDLETAEAGALYDDRSGNLVLKPRTARYGTSPGLTIAFTSDVIKGYAPKVDRQGLANVGTGKGPAGNDLVYEDAASRDDYGDADYSVETTALDPDEPFQLVAWRINGNAQPRPRVPAPEFSVIDFIGGSIASLLGLDIGSKLRLTNGPTQAPNATSADYFVEGYSESMGVGTWTLAPNLSPVTLEDSVLVLDGATNGLLDANVIAL